MKIYGNTILITGGAIGIGFALAEKFVALNNKVIVCDVAKVSLVHAKQRIKDLRIEACDVTDDASIIKLVKKLEEMGGINVLINNAAVGKNHDLLDENFSADDAWDELNVNFLGPVRVTKHFLPLLQKQKDAVIINISAGLAFIPYYKSPMYSASKSALHSYTMAFRHQLKLKNSPIKVIEIFPPAVDTRMSRNQVGVISAEKFAELVIKALETDKTEIVIGDTKKLYFMSRFMPKAGFKFINSIMDQKSENLDENV